MAAVPSTCPFASSWDRLPVMMPCAAVLRVEAKSRRRQTVTERRCAACFAMRSNDMYKTSLQRRAAGRLAEQCPVIVRCRSDVSSVCHSYIAGDRAMRACAATWKELKVCRR